MNQRLQVMQRPKNLIARHIADMTRTSTATATAGGGTVILDLPKGSPIHSLQVNDLDPGEHTIQFETYPPPDDDGFSAYAIVTWKVGGQQITRKTSIGSGAAITGVAEGVDVQIVDYSGTLIAAERLPYKIGASLSRGGRADTMQPATLLTSTRAVAIAGGASKFFLIPKGSGVISCMPLAASEAGATLADSLEIVAFTQDSAGGIVNIWYPLLQNPGWVPITGRGFRVGIRNDSAVIINANVVWGIEG